MNLRRTLWLGLLSLILLRPEVTSAQTASELFSPGVLHDVVLRVNSRDLDELRATYHLNTYYPADLQWGETIVRNVAIRSRGRASRSGVKLALRVDINYFVGGQTFFGLKSLVLDNLYQDPSMLHEHAAMALFTRLGMVAPRTSFARLFINDEYQGVYALVEEPNDTFVEDRFGPDKGYLFEYHRLGPYHFEDLGDDLAVYQQHFEARTHELAAPSVLYAPLREMVWAREGESLNQWRTRVSRFIDLAQLVRMVAIEQFLSEFDGLTGHAGVNNFYLYRPFASEQHIVIPWDRDQAFDDPDSLIYFRVGDNHLVRQALAFSDLHAIYLDQLHEAARVTLEDDWLERLVVHADSLVSAAAQADRRKPYANDEREVAMRELVTFMRRRPYSVINQVGEARAGGVGP